MSDYSSYSTDELKAIYKHVLSAYRGLHCELSRMCNECCVRHDCDALEMMTVNLRREIFERKAKGVSHGEEKENRP